MSNNLELKVLFTAIDKFVRPVKNITQGAKEASAALKINNDRLRELEKTAEQIDAFKKLERDIAITANAFKGAQVRIEALKSEIARVGAPTKALSRDMADATKEAEALKNKHQSLSTAEQQLFQKLKASGVDTRFLTEKRRELAHATVEAAAASKKLQTAMEAENQKMKRLRAAQAELTKSRETAGKLAMAGAKITAGGVAVGLPVAKAAKDFAEFETAMLGVARQMEGAKDANGQYTRSYYEMADAVKAMSERSSIGKNANDIAAIVEAGARMGIQGKENLLLYTEVTAVMSSAFDLPVDQVGEDIGKISQLYRVPMKDIKSLGDTINWLDDNALSKGGDIIDVMKRIAGTADMVKMSFKDAAALGSTFLSLGATSEVAASASNAMIRELSIATMQNSASFKGGMSMLGLNAAGVQSGMIKDATGTIIKVLEKIKALPGEKQLEAATRLFGKEFGDDAAKLASNLDEYRKQLKLVNDEKARGSMQREADTRGGTLNARMDTSKNALINLSTDLGAHLKPALVETMEKTLALVHGLRDWAKENPVLSSGIMTTVKNLALMLTVIGGLALAASAIIVPLAMVKLSMTTLGLSGFSAAGLLSSAFRMVGTAVMTIGRAMLMNPIGLAITAIAVGAFLIYKYWEPIKAFFSGLWDQVRQAFGGGLTGILALIANWSPIGLFYKAMASVLGYFGIELPGKFTEFGGNLMAGLVSGITNGIKAAKAAIGGAGDAVIGYFKEKLGIRSPSRVFAELGQFTMAGLEQGLSGGEGGPLGAVSAMAKKLAVAGAGLALGIPAFAQPMTSAVQQANGGRGGDTYHITIQAAPGADAQSLAAEVERVLERIETKKSAQRRSRLRDTE